MKKGIVEVKVKLYLEMDLDDDEIQDMISEMDYNFSDYRIQETEIMGIE